MNSKLTQAIKRLHPKVRARLRRELVVRQYSTTLMTLLVEGLNYNTLLYWVRTKLLCASVRYTRKQWGRVLFSHEDLFYFAVVTSLREREVPVPRIRRVLTILRSRNSDNKATYLDVTTDRVLALRAAEVATRFMAHSITIILNISRLRDEIDARLRKVSAALAQQEDSAETIADIA